MKNTAIVKKHGKHGNWRKTRKTRLPCFRDFLLSLVLSHWDRTFLFLTYLLYFLVWRGLWSLTSNTAWDLGVNGRAVTGHLHLHHISNSFQSQAFPVDSYTLWINHITRQRWAYTAQYTEVMPPWHQPPASIHTEHHANANQCYNLYSVLLII